jgi:tetratricopeptide (TPR) repeat protein
MSSLRASPPRSDEDAFEAVVCLFVCGDLDSALNVCRTHPWKQEWAMYVTSALSQSLEGEDASRALELAGKSVGTSAVPYDAAAIFLLLLQKDGRSEEADAFIRTRLQDAPASETFLQTIMAEIALSTGNLREAYRGACAVLAADPIDYRALIVMSMASYEIGNIHESLGHAMRANMVRKGSLPATLQLMRCRNKLGNYYGAVAAFDMLGDATPESADVHVELGKAYEGLADTQRAVAEYRAALTLGGASGAAVRALVALHAAGGQRTELEALIAAYPEEINGDFVCQAWVGLEALNRGALERASQRFRKTFELSDAGGEPLRALPWPVPEPRVRHDCEQLELLAARGKLDAAGRDALRLLRRYCAQASSPEAKFAPEGDEGEALKSALQATFYIPEQPFSGSALGANDYAAIEETYLAERVVVIDGFLSSNALAALRRVCEEATVWKLNYERGYLGALLAHGFSPKVLLGIAYELKKAMPRVIGDHPLTQAWAYKYDQRMQGINMHADFADVNVNFWITPDSACEDPTTGGMVVYDLPVPRSWTFYEYNNESEKLAVYLRVHKANARRVPYRENRCVLFDSRLIHITDEMHFKPGYENRRVNVTLLYGGVRGN